MTRATLLTTTEAAQRAGMTVQQFRGHVRRRHIVAARRIPGVRGQQYFAARDVDDLARTIAAQRAAAWPSERSAA